MTLSLVREPEPSFKRTSLMHAILGSVLSTMRSKVVESPSSVRQKTFVNHLSAVQFVFRMHK